MKLLNTTEHYQEAWQTNTMMAEKHNSLAQEALPAFTAHSIIIMG